MFKNKLLSKLAPSFNQPPQPPIQWRSMLSRHDVTNTFKWDKWKRFGVQISIIKKEEILIKYIFQFGLMPSPSGNRKDWTKQAYGTGYTWGLLGVLQVMVDISFQTWCLQLCWECARLFHDDNATLGICECTWRERGREREWMEA